MDVSPSFRPCSFARRHLFLLRRNKIRMPSLSLCSILADEKETYGHAHTVLRHSKSSVPTHRKRTGRIFRDSETCFHHRLFSSSSRDRLLIVRTPSLPDSESFQASSGSWRHCSSPARIRNALQRMIPSPLHADDAIAGDHQSVRWRV